MEARLSASLLKTLSRDLRLSVIETHCAAGGGHLGSSLSIVESLVVLFQNHFCWQPLEAQPWCGDRFVLSKGHAALALYCALVLFDRLDRRLLSTFGANGTPLEPHPNEKMIPGIHASTGSLGQGFSIAVGLALGSQLRGTPDRVFAIVGDGELNEGQTWEAARSAATLHLKNLFVILDDNRMQQDGPTPEIMPVADVLTSWKAMGWECLEVDGHDCTALDNGIRGLIHSTANSPKMLLAHTIKAKGIEFLEGRTESHFPPPLSPDDLAIVRYSLDQSLR